MLCNRLVALVVFCPVFPVLRVAPAKSKKEFKIYFYFSLDLYVSCVGAASMNITQICVCSTVSVMTFISLNRNYFKTTLFHTGL